MFQNLMKMSFAMMQIMQNFIDHSRLLPKEVYAFFHSDVNKKQRYHFARYALWLFRIYAIVFMTIGILTGLFGGDAGAAGSSMLLALLMTTFSFIATRAEAAWETSGNFMAWYPGVGYLAKDGSFRPMPWPSFIANCRWQLGPQNSIRKHIQAASEQVALQSNAGTPAQFLPPAVHIPFALGAANVGETVLRGTKIIDGYQYRQQLEGAARMRGEGGLNGGLVTFGAVPWDYTSEPQHCAITGKSGAGKSVAINTMLRTVRDWRGQSAVIADPAGGYLARFGRDSDFLLNPFDLRSEDWNPFAEMQYDYDAAIIASSVIPEGNGSSDQWNHYARTILTEVLKALWLRGEKNVSEVLRFCASASTTELATLLNGSPAASMCDEGADGMLAGARGIIGTYMSSWVYLKDGGTFSVRKYIRESDTLGGAWLFMPYTDAQMGMLKYLISTWTDLATIEMLSMQESNSRRLFFILDELDSLGKIGSLKAGLTKGRKYGSCYVCGIQTYSQLRSTYGKDDAQTLLSCMATKLVLSPGDNETADHMSKELGEQEIERTQTSDGTSTKFGEIAMMGNKSVNTHLHRENKNAVMPAQLLGLPNLQGYLRMPGTDVLQVVLPYVKIEENFKPYEPKERI